MSGSQIGGVLGGVIGFVVGGPAGAQWGVAIGSTVGSYIDPDVIKAPSIGDAARQGSTAGWPIPKIYGHPAPQSVCLIDGDPVARKITVETEQGKGAPATVESEKFIATRCFLVCEGEIAGYARIRRNGKLVYSTIAGDQLDADSAAFRSQLRLYYGTETQLPDPALEAIHGVGNAHAYRGKAYFVVVDDDEGQSGTPNQYQVEPVASGTITSTVPGYSAKEFAGNKPWASNAPALRDPRSSLTSYQYAYIPPLVAYNDASITWRATPDEAIADAASATGNSVIGTAELMGWCMDFDGPVGNGVLIAPWEDITADPVDWSDRYVLGLVYARYSGETVAALTTEPDNCGFFPEPVWAAKIKTEGGVTLHANATIQNTSDGPAGYDTQDYCDDGSGPLVQEYNIYTGFTIACRPVPVCGANDRPAESIEIPDTSGWYADYDGNLYGGQTCAVVTGTFKQLSLLTTDYEDPPSFTGAKVTNNPLGPVLAAGDPNYSNATYWTDAYNAAVAAGDMPAGKTYDNGTGGENTYPRVTTTACQCTLSVPLIDPDAAILRDIVLDIAGRVPAFPIDRMSVGNMLDEVPGYRLTRSDLSAIDYMIDVATPYWYDFADYDDQIHGIARGGAIVETITDDDLLELEDEDVEVRNQQIEYPGRVTFFYPDPANNYVMTPQTAARESPDVLSSSAINIQTQIPFTATQAIQRADIFQKIAFARAEGKIRRALPSYYTRLVPSDPIFYQDRRWRITKTERDDSMITIEADYDRNMYDSSMTGESGPTPQSQVSNIKGPTLVVPVNLPQLRSQDSSPGLYMPACGLLDGWPGCDVYMSVDSGASYQAVMRITRGATIGELSEACDEDGADSTGLIRVRIYNGGSLQSITDEQMAARRNGFALITADVAEVGQFQTATEGAEHYYDLTDVLRGQLETDAVPHVAGTRFVLLDPAPPFLPIDLEHSGKVLLFKGVTLGTSIDAAPVVSILYTAPEYVQDGGEI